MTIECDECDRPSEYHIEQRSPEGDGGVYTGYFCEEHALEAVDHGLTADG